MSHNDGYRYDFFKTFINVDCLIQAEIN